MIFDAICDSRPKDLESFRMVLAARTAYREWPEHTGISPWITGFEAVTDQQLINFALICPEMKHLSMNLTYLIFANPLRPLPHRGLTFLLQKCKKLNSLKIAYWKDFSTHVLGAISEPMANLRRFALSGVSGSEMTPINFEKITPNLRELNINTRGRELFNMGMLHF